MAQRLLLVPPLGRTLSQAESLALVQIFLNVSLACIAHARQLIPWTSPCFSTRYVDQINLDDQPDGQTLYSAFQAHNPNHIGEGQEIKVLVRGGHPRADQLLDMLEKGVFNALEHGYLDGVQAFVTRTLRGELSVRENYHFVFDYDQGRVSSIQLSPTNHKFVLGDVHKSFKAATRALLRSLRDLPNLPARRKFGMSLSYNRTCPTLYQPPGFVDKNAFPDGGAQAMCNSLEAGTKDVVGMLDTGHYQVRVTACLSDSEAQEASIDLQDTEMSKQLQAMQKTSSSHTHNLPSTSKGSTPLVKRRADVAVSISKRPKVTAVEEPVGQEAIIGFMHASTSANVRGSSVLESKSATTSHLPDDSFDAATDLPRKCGARLVVAKLAELLIHCYAVQNRKPGDDGIVFQQDLLAEGKIQRLSRAADISCECGSRERSSGMLYCEVCDSWQHKDCYGYNENLACAIVPDEHFCYTCLLFTEKPRSEPSPLSIILLRKAVDYLTTQIRSGTRIDQSFLQTRLKPPRWTKEILEQVTERLLEEGLLLRRSGRLFEVKSLKEPDLLKINENCTCPLASVAHLFETSPSSEDPVRRSARILQALEAYAHGQDYTMGEGCEELISYDEFGDAEIRWGYRRALSAPLPDAVAEARTPAHRRKISISRILINIDSSPATTSATSVEERASRFGSELAYNTDSADSTATAD